MDVEEIRESGILELYVAGELSGRQMDTVEGYVKEFPALKEDLISIGNALESYARMHEVPVSSTFKSNLLSAVQNTSETTPIRPISPKRNSGWWAAAASVLLIVSAVSLYQYSQLNSQLAELEKEKEKTVQTQAELLAEKEAEIAKFKALHTADSRVITLAATDKFQTSNVVMYLDDTSKKNYIELKDMPDISSDQSYQLWSLKAEVAPIPLNVFQGDEEIFEVAYEEGTGTYAITIEPFGGQEAPSLENLIGTITI